MQSSGFMQHKEALKTKHKVPSISEDRDDEAAVGFSSLTEIVWKHTLGGRKMHSSLNCKFHSP